MQYSRMDDFSCSWENPLSAMRTAEILPVQSCQWSTRQLDGFPDYDTLSGKLELGEASLVKSDNVLDLQQIMKPCQASSDLGRFGQAMDSIDTTSVDHQYLLHEQDLIKLQTVSERVVPAPFRIDIATSGVLWDDQVLASQLCAFPAAACNNLQQSFATAGEDEGRVSTIFSSSENTRNLSSSGNISSGESENYDKKNMEAMSNCYSLPDEALSQCSSIHADGYKSKRKFNEDLDQRHSLYVDILQPSTPTTTDHGGFQINFEDSSRTMKRTKSFSQASSINFRTEIGFEPDTEAIAQVKEMIYRAAALQPVNLGLEEPMEKPRRKNVRISSDPQTVAARHRRERISERLRRLQRLVPGGSKMDTASMLDEAANYLKFLKSQVGALEAQRNTSAAAAASLPQTSLPQASLSMQPLFKLPKHTS